MAKTKVQDNGASMQTGFVIPPPKIVVRAIPITGITSLIVHAWSEKAKRMMLDKQMKKAAAPKAAKDPQEDYRSSTYVADEGWHGVPASSFKSAMVGACRAVEGLPMTMAKRMIFVVPDGISTAQNVELIRIEGKPRMREDMVRLESGVADIRYRAEYFPWKAVVRVEINVGVVSVEQVVNLLDLAGLTEGICEWRPSAPKSASGEHGRWRVDRE